MSGTLWDTSDSTPYDGSIPETDVDKESVEMKRIVCQAADPSLEFLETSTHHSVHMIK